MLLAFGYLAQELIRQSLTELLMPVSKRGRPIPNRLNHLAPREYSSLLDPEFQMAGPGRTNEHWDDLARKWLNVDRNPTYAEDHIENDLKLRRGTKKVRGWGKQNPSTKTPKTREPLPTLTDEWATTSGSGRTIFAGEPLQNITQVRDWDGALAECKVGSAGSISSGSSAGSIGSITLGSSGISISSSRTAGSSSNPQTPVRPSSSMVQPPAPSPPSSKQ